jgi:hypothetical protein
MCCSTTCSFARDQHVVHRLAANVLKPTERSERSVGRDGPEVTAPVRFTQRPELRGGAD